MIRVDPSIFKDVVTVPSNAPSAESLQKDAKEYSMKIIRLKKSPWTKDVVITSNPSECSQMQTALLYSEDNKIDTLMKGCMEFLDINDMASINLVISESA